jgi:hypothetical protein
VGTGYEILLTLHLLCAIGGFGYLAYSGLALQLGRRRGAAIGTLEVLSQISGLAELLVYGAFVFGVAAVGSSHSWSFSQAWVIAALALYLAALGVLHGMIRPARKEYTALAAALVAKEAPSPGPPPEVDRIASLERRIVRGWGIFNVVVVAVVVLMVVRPGA